MGLSTTVLAVEMGTRVIAADLSVDRQEMALAKGADVAIDPNEVDPVEALKKLTHDEEADKTMARTSSA